MTNLSTIVMATVFPATVGHGLPATSTRSLWCWVVGTLLLTGLSLWLTLRRGRNVSQLESAQVPTSVAVPAGLEFTIALEQLVGALDRYRVSPHCGLPPRAVLTRCWELRDLLTHLDQSDSGLVQLCNAIGAVPPSDQPVVIPLDAAETAVLLEGVETWLKAIEQFDQATDKCCGFVSWIAQRWAFADRRSYDAEVLDRLRDVQRASRPLFRGTVALTHAIERAALCARTSVSLGQGKLAVRLDAVSALCASQISAASHNFDTRAPTRRPQSAPFEDERATSGKERHEC